MPFKALGLSPKILKAIQDSGYTEPTPIQIKGIPAVMRGKDMIGIAQTGTGKTAAYALPILERLSTTVAPQGGGKRVPRALILTPTRELAVQVFDTMREYAKYIPLKFAAVYGGVSDTPQIRTLREGVDVIVATPGRLLDLMSTLQAPVRDVEILILDEADRMLDMGFIPDIRRIVRALPTDRQTLLFSATFSSDIEKISREFLTTPETVEVGKRATPVESVAQFVYEVPKALKPSLLVHLLKDEGLDSVLVFSRTKHGADKISKRLSDEGIATAALHSNRSQGQRLAALKGFKAGHYRVLVATDIAARGIDVDGISHVVNFDFPAHPEDYVHRIGRTGRAQAIGDALSFVTPEDMTALRGLERFIGRGVPRRIAAGFDYHARVPMSDGPRHRERTGPPERGRRPAPGGSSGRGAPPHRGQRPSSSGSSTGGSRPAGRARPQASSGNGGQPSPSVSRVVIVSERPTPRENVDTFGRPGKGGRARRGRR